jgi:hypothetical protein
MEQNLVFSYADGLCKNETLETSAKISITTLLRPLEKEIVEKNARVHVLFLHHGQRLLSLRGADVELHVKCKERIDQFKLKVNPEISSYFF